MSVEEASAEESVWFDAADAAMDAACAGWQRQHRCVDENGTRVLHPHPACLRAQYQHDLILIEHGLL